MVMKAQPRMMSPFQYYLIFQRDLNDAAAAPTPIRVVWANAQGFGPMGSEPPLDAAPTPAPGQSLRALGFGLEDSLAKAHAGSGERVGAQRLVFRPGQTIPCAHRPLLAVDPDGAARPAGHGAMKIEAPRDADRVSALQARIKLLLTRLHELLGVVSPTEKQLKTYGHEIAGLLGQAGIEFESECAEILRLNGLKTPRNPKILAYWPLFAPLNLDQPAVRLKRYPELGEIAPMVGWTLTKGPAWYKAHHQLKQNRSAKLHKATLRNAVDGVASVVALLVQQYGADMVEELSLDRQIEVAPRFATPVSESYFITRDAALGEGGGGFFETPLADVMADDERIRRLISPKHKRAAA
ncbi:MAG: hypothetical protein AAFR16_01385 [Pseudomonadota bacterium]